MTPRAAPMAAEDRRTAILAAALPLLREHGRATTTRQIAEAAGIAEGTVFRVFASKEELFEAAFAQAFDPMAFFAELDGIDAELPLRERLVALVTVLQRRFMEIFAFMTAMAMTKPPQPGTNQEHWRERGNRGMVRLVRPDADQFRVTPEEVVNILRLLTFSGSHPHISDGQLLTPDQIVDVVLHGTLKGSAGCS